MGCLASKEKIHYKIIEDNLIGFLNCTVCNEKKISPDNSWSSQCDECFVKSKSKYFDKEKPLLNQLFKK